MNNIKSALKHLKQKMGEQDNFPIRFEEYLQMMTARPESVFRNIFQVFHDMVKAYVGEGMDEYPDDPESINFVFYDYSRLFIKGSDHPFFADRLFANRLTGLVEALKRGSQQNKIYIFEGPPGSGKSTFLNNLLRKFEEYANSQNGAMYESVWKLSPEMLNHNTDPAPTGFKEKGFPYPIEQTADEVDVLIEQTLSRLTETALEIPCPSHDNPILLIPKEHRRPLFEDLFKEDEFRKKLFSEKEYAWVFRDQPCTICSSLYQALLNKLKSPLKVFSMLYARPYRFNRRLGEGITVFNAGDKPVKQNVLTNPMLQRRINSILKDSNQVKYVYSRYAKTNNGIYTLMDIKSNNTERLIELHNIISEGLHKVEDTEENVNSLFLAIMNPEDRENIQDFQSFTDRIEYINIPYVLDLNTEVEIYRNVFGGHVDKNFLPRVLHNFARVIISSRLSIRSEAMLEWIGDPDKYRLFCDDNLQLLKMEIYTGHIPSWLSEEDRRRFTAKRRRRIIAESETEGNKGFSGRDSIKIFNEFYSYFGKEDKLINMSFLYGFFTKVRRDLHDAIPRGFLDSVLRMYNYTILQEVKESLYYYNEEQISKDLQNYLFAVNFEPGAVEVCKFTGDRLEITEDFFRSIETRLLGSRATTERRFAFRKEVQNEYTSKTLTREILLEGKPLTRTELYDSLHERYIYNLKQKVLNPFLENENFRRGIKDFGEESFKTYDKKIRDDVTFLMNNLNSKFRYTRKGAKEVCIYVMDNELPRKFENS